MMMNKSICIYLLVDRQIYELAGINDLTFRYTDAKLVEFLEECSFMDPRFKCLSWLPEDKRLEVYDRVARKILEISKAEIDDNDDRVANDNDDSVAESGSLLSQEPTEPEEGCSSD